jgi:hypothetical protein
MQFLYVLYLIHLKSSGSAYDAACIAGHGVRRTEAEGMFQRLPKFVPPPGLKPLSKDKLKKKVPKKKA